MLSACQGTEVLASMMLNSMLSAFQQLKCLPALLLNIIEQNKCTAGQIHAERISTSEVLASIMLNSAERISITEMLASIMLSALNINNGLMLASISLGVVLVMLASC